VGRRSSLRAPKDERDELVKEASHLADIDRSLHLSRPRLIPLRPSDGFAKPSGTVTYDRDHRIDCALAAYALLDLAEFDQHWVVVILPSTTPWRSPPITTGPPPACWFVAR
jgi:hypothetical protein